MTISNLGAILDPTAPDDRPFIIELSPDGDERGRTAQAGGDGEEHGGISGHPRTDSRALDRRHLCVFL